MLTIMKQSKDLHHWPKLTQVLREYGIAKVR